MARIIIADDSPSVRLLMSTLVIHAGHEVVWQAENGLEALTGFFNVHPDLLIVDYQMPVMDGLSLIKAIKSYDPDVKVMMCTASLEEPYGELQKWVDIKVVEKPFDNLDFIESIAATLES